MFAMVISLKLRRENLQEFHNLQQLLLYTLYYFLINIVFGWGEKWRIEKR